MHNSEQNFLLLLQYFKENEISATMFVRNSNNKWNEASLYGIQLFQSDGETCKTITVACRIFEHA